MSMLLFVVSLPLTLKKRRIHQMSWNGKEKAGPAMHIVVHPPRQVCDAGGGLNEDQDFTISAASSWTMLPPSHVLSQALNGGKEPCYYVGAVVQPNSLRMAQKTTSTVIVTAPKSDTAPATVTGSQKEETDKAQKEIIAVVPMTTRLDTQLMDDYKVPILLRPDGGCIRIETAKWTKFVIFDLDPTVFAPAKQLNPPSAAAAARCASQFYHSNVSHLNDTGHGNNPSSPSPPRISFTTVTSVAAAVAASTTPSAAALAELNKKTQEWEREPWEWTGPELYQILLEHDEPSSLVLRMELQQAVHAKTKLPLACMGVGL
jgi:hypothetical protein